MFDRNSETRALASAQRASLGTGRLDESLHVHRVSPGQVMLASDWSRMDRVTRIIASHWLMLATHMFVEQKCSFANWSKKLLNQLLLEDRPRIRNPAL